MYMLYEYNGAGLFGGRRLGIVGLIFGSGLGFWELGPVLRSGLGSQVSGFG